MRKRGKNPLQFVHSNKLSLFFSSLPVLNLGMVLHYHNWSKDFISYGTTQKYSNLLFTLLSNSHNCNFGKGLLFHGVCCVLLKHSPVTTR